MNKRNLSEFKNACRVALITFNLSTLRAYGRFLQLKEPTKLQKAALIEEILCVLCGESKPQRSKRGAPSKSDYIDPTLIEKIENLQEKYFPQPSAQNVLRSEENRKDIQDADTLAQVHLQFSIQPSTLNEKQKQLLNDFLNSL